MEESSSIMIEKPFSCAIDGCLMKFTNEDHLTVHKKRHDMVLNLGLAPKGNTFSDQTPTPTRFIRNCEEVGLFQDLQNVNPFEETFRKAAEAVKTGQIHILDKSFQSNVPDDTLHTPNIFPHIADLQSVNHGGSLVNQENKQSQDDMPKKENDDMNSNEKELPLKHEHEPRKLILGSVSHKKRKKENCDKPLVIEVENNTFNELASGIDKPHQQVFTETISETSSVQLALKEKIKNGLQNRQPPTVIQLKVPIPKSNSTIRCQKSQKDKFSTFSKNSLKYESKLEKPQSGIFDLSKKRRAKKSYNGLPKERIEILERNRAAATRCREKKKSYISYLEKLSRELTDANKKLQFQNNHFRKQISVLQNELLKHEHCNVTTSKKAVILTTVASVESNKESNIPLEAEAIKNPVESMETVTVKIDQENNSLKCGDDFEAVRTVFDTVEVPFSENLIEGGNMKSPYFETMDISNTEPNLSKLLCEEESLKKVYSDHSYSTFASAIDAGKRSHVSNVCKSKVNTNFLAKDIKFQKVIDKSDKELFNAAVTQGLNPSFGTLGSTEPTIIVSQPAFVLKAPIKRKSKTKQP